MAADVGLDDDADEIALAACREVGDVFAGGYDDAAVLRLYESQEYKAAIDWATPAAGDAESFGVGGKALCINGVQTGWGYGLNTGPDKTYSWCVIQGNTEAFVRDEIAARALVVMAYASTVGRERLDAPYERVREPQRDLDRPL